MTEARKLSSMDASFLYLETPEMPMHVGSMAIFRLPENYNGNFFEDFTVGREFRHATPRTLTEGDAADLRFGAVQCQPEGRVVELEQHLAFADKLIVLHFDRDHPAGNAAGRHCRGRASG